MTGDGFARSRLSTHNLLANAKSLLQHISFSPERHIIKRKHLKLAVNPLKKAGRWSTVRAVSGVKGLYARQKFKKETDIKISRKSAFRQQEALRKFNKRAKESEWSWQNRRNGIARTKLLQLTGLKHNLSENTALNQKIERLKKEIKTVNTGRNIITSDDLANMAKEGALRQIAIGNTNENTWDLTGVIFSDGSESMLTNDNVPRLSP